MLTIEDIYKLWDQHRPAAEASVREFALGSRRFDFNSHPFIMGVVNLSADSWYRESVCLSADQAIERGRVLAAQGAAVIDVGAESTLSHAALVAERNQRSMLLPVVKGLAASKLIVSVETYHPEVAQAALKAGARIINMTGTNAASEIYKMAAGHSAAVIICHIQGRNARKVGDFDMSNIIEKMRDYFARQIELADKAGLKKIILDPGLGFYYRNLQDGATRVRHQMTTFLHTFRLRSLGFPVCHALPHAFEYFGEEVRCAEPFFAVLAALGKTDLFRTHEVPRTRAVLETLKAF